MGTAIDGAARRAHAWLTDAALPIWGTAGIDASGHFHERLNFDGSPDLTSNRRMRVQARQLYVYSEAAVRGWWTPARQVADAGFEALVRDCWSRDGQPGWLHTLTPDLRPLDQKRDTYDHAFALFGLAWYHKASGNPRALALAHATLDVMQGALADPDHGGFLESLPPVLPRRSDPHMHTLEACLEWFSITRDDRFLNVARQMAALFETRFFDAATGTLGEFFKADLTPAEGGAGQTTTPGHHFEWTWLLAWARDLGAADAKAKADVLYAYAMDCGLDDLKLAVDETDRQGRQVRASRRAWPQTELIKAHLTKAREGVPGAAEAAAQAAETFLDTYLATDIPGLWMDQFDADGGGMTDAAPASTLYHVVVAFRELMQFAQSRD
jgi:mannose-6-phosphate isomerase